MFNIFLHFNALDFVIFFTIYLYITSTNNEISVYKILSLNN